MDDLIGLSKNQVLSLQQKFGPNKIAEKSPNSFIHLIISQVASPLIYILIIAAVITLFLGHFTDTAVILASVILNTALGFFQEKKAQDTLASLNKLIAPKTKVIRDGKRQIISASELVPGDIVVMELGTRIPADGIVIEEHSLTVNEAILTGESAAVTKKAAKNNYPEAKDAEKVFMGTIVASGIAKMRVETTGTGTKMGKIAFSLKKTKEPKTPLQKKLDEISKFLSVFVAIAGLGVFIVGIIMGHSFLEMFTTSVALAVASIPEGLAVSLTVILAVGMQRILKRNAVVRKLMAAETLGSVNVICTDKTGTLTEGIMRVTGSDFTDKKLGLVSVVLCNDQRDPLEISMYDWAKNNSDYDLSLTQGYKRLSGIPFDPTYKYIATLYQKNNINTLLVSGAPEIILAQSKISSLEEKKWLEKIDFSAEKGLRLVAFAYKDFSASKISKKDINNLKFLGLVYFEDPPRLGVKQALEECNKAGIKVKVITGDYKKTAVAVMEKIGLFDSKNKPVVAEGSQLEKMNFQQKVDCVLNSHLFSRVTPWQKLEIVEILQNHGNVVAMTGDGVNDAPALKKADIGIVVESASDVSKQIADMILLDSKFATIVHAVEEGRGMFDNIRKIILYLLADAFGEVILVLGSLLAGVPIALSAAQILWINLVSDGFPGLALTVEPKEKGLMQKPPRSQKEPVINAEIKVLIGLISGFAGILTFILYLYYLLYLNVSVEYARTVAFAALGINSLIYVFSCRSLDKPIWRDNPFKNIWLILAVIGGAIFQLSALYLPVLQRFLNTVNLRARDWELIIMINLLVIFMIEGVKWLFINKNNKKV